MRITRVYTRTGDDGTTTLVGGQRVPKNDARIEAYGTGDELMSILGWARQEAIAERERFTNPADADTLEKTLEFLANKLFTLNADLATRFDDRFPGMPIIEQSDIDVLEKMIDHYNGGLPPLLDFILPGGSRASAALHVARTVCRRAERRVITLSEHENTGDDVIRFINRLADLLFVLARWTTLKQGVKEFIWRRDLPVPPLPAMERFRPDCPQVEEISPGKQKNGESTE